MAEQDRIIEMTKALGRAIQLDERYKALMAAREENDNNEKLQQAIGQFELAKFNLSAELNKEDGDKDKIMRYNTEMQDAYAIISDFQSMQAYADVKRDMDKLYNWVNAILVTAMNGGDPDGVAEPQSECSGSCESCGGCS